MHGGLFVQCLRGGVLLGKVEPDIRIPRDGLERHVHQAHQLERAEISRRAIQSIFCRRSVSVKTALAGCRDFETDLLRFGALHLGAFSQRVEATHHGVRTPFLGKGF